MADIKYCKDKPKILFLILGCLVSLNKLYKTKVPKKAHTGSPRQMTKNKFVDIPC